MAVSIPEATAPAFSKATWIYGTPHDVYGYIEVTTSRQPVGLTTITSGPVALSMSLAANVAPQAGHAVWPGAKYSSLGISSNDLINLTFTAILPHPHVGGFLS